MLARIAPLITIKTYTVIYEVATDERISVSGWFVHATSAADLEIYSSPNLTSASGDLIYKKTYAIDDTLDVSQLIDSGFKEGENLIAVASVAGLNTTMTYTLYTGNDV
mgnify:CR=1 FL=1